MSTSADNSLLTAINIAETDATARIQAAVESAQLQAQAEEQVASTRASADIQVATIQASAAEQVASTEASARIQAAQIDQSWHSQVATIEAGATTTSAQTNASAEVSAANAHAQATIAAANSAAAAQVSAANIDASWHGGVASIEAAAQEAVAATNAQAQITSSSQQATATITAASTNAGAQVEVATIDASWRANVAQIQASAQIQSATIDASWHQGVASTELQGTEYKANQDLAGVNVHEAAETYRLNLKLGFANDKFNLLLPVIDQALGIAGGATGGGSIGFGASTTNRPVMGFGAVMGNLTPSYNTSDVEEMGFYSYKRSGLLQPMRMGSGDVKSGGIGFATGSSVADAVAATQLPFIDTSGVLTPAQIQQQVNAAYARNDAKTNSETLSLIQDMTGRGFSANSPILGALRVGLTGQNLRSSILAEQQIRLESAKANATQILDSQKALSDQFIAQEGVLIDEEKNDVTRTVGILQAISQIVGSAL